MTDRGRSLSARGIALLALPLAGGLLLPGCATRDPSNPFDPDNPDTGGVPPALEAVATDGAVELRWSIPGYDDLAGIEVFRESGTGDPVPVLEDAGPTGETLDAGLVNGTTYVYRLFVRTDSGERLPSAPDLATPGTAAVWFGDASGGGLGRLSPDARDVAFRRESSRGFLDLAVHPDGSVWGADFFFGEVVQYDRNGERVRAIPRLGSNAIALDVAGGQIWVGSFVEQSLSRYSLGGALSFELEDVGPIEDLEIEPIPRTGLWAAVRGVGVVEVVNEVVTRRWTDFTWPVALARDPAGWVWVVDRGGPSVAQIYVGSGQVVPSRAELGDPRDLALDGQGGVWIADPERGGILHLDSSGEETLFLAVGAASGVTLDPVRNQLWVVLRREGRIAVFDPDGSELARVTVGGSPVKVEADWGE